MKKQRNNEKKYILFVIVIISIFFLAGWNKKKVELLDDAKLINLNKAIELAKPGGDSFKKTQKAHDEVDQKEKKDGITKEENIVIVVRVRNQTIIYNGVTINDIDQLEQNVRRDNKENVVFSLKDEWAEAHTYKNVLGILSNLHSEIGLNYTNE